MPVERSFRRFTPYSLGVEPQLLSAVHRAGVEIGLELSIMPQHHWLAEEARHDVVRSRAIVFVLMSCVVAIFHHGVFPINTTR